MVSQFAHAKDLGFGVVLAKATQLVDDFASAEATSLNDVVESDVRQLTVANSTSSLFIGCFID